MDATGSRRAAVVGVSEGGPMSLLFAATHPLRVAGLVIYGSLPRFLWAPDFPWGQTRAEWDRELEHEIRHWGTIEQAREINPDADDIEAERIARRRRLSASPNAFRQIELMNQSIDVREDLPAIGGADTRASSHAGISCRSSGARWTAGQIPGAAFIELAGSKHFPSWATTRLSSTRSNRS